MRDRRAGPAEHGLRSAEGFTLVELLVALVVAVLVAAAASTAFQLGTRTLLAAAAQTEAQQNARWALERMISEIRGAGYDPTGRPPAYTFDPIVGATPTSLTIQSDFNGNGILDPPGACDPTAVTERVAYRLSGTQLLRATDPPANACESVVVSGVTALRFTYLDADGNPAATPAAIRTVVVTVTVRAEGAQGPGTVAMTDRVRLRNR